MEQHIQTSIEEAASHIRSGRLVAFPTETVYGLGANALDARAVAKIFALKERPSFDPLIVHIADLDDITLLSGKPSEPVLALARSFLPGPLTIVLPKTPAVPDIVTAGLPTVGIRMPDNNIALGMIRAAGLPVAAPSANKFGCLSPVCAQHVAKQLPGVDFILDGGHTAIGIESTIVAIEGNVCTMLRPGRITAADIEQALPGLFRFREHSSAAVLASGQLNSHYSPAKPLFLRGRACTPFAPHTGLIVHSDAADVGGCAKLLYTSRTGDLLEVASRLFDALHTMEDDPAVVQIFIDPVPVRGIGAAIMDRINKAAYKYRLDH